MEPPTADDYLELGSSEQGIDRHASGQAERPTSPLIAVPYVETSPMRIDVQYEGVRAEV